MTTQARTEDSPSYTTDQQTQGDEIIRQALAILDTRSRISSTVFDSTSAAQRFARLYFAPVQDQHEEFAVFFLDTQHRLIASETMFRGTLASTSVYPREVVKRALALNAGSVVFAHNHPSGSTEPSRADEHLTQTLKAALSMVDVRVLDHLITGSMGCLSMAARGLI
jgi:DNA repair protein RadC